MMSFNGKIKQSKKIKKAKYSYSAFEMLIKYACILCCYAVTRKCPLFKILIRIK